MPASTPSREFLAWDDPRPVLERAADRLVALYGADLGEVVVALPGRRAVRRLEQHLATRLNGAAPRLVTVGHLPDELLLPARPIAGRLLRTLLWRDALRGLPESRRAPLLRHPPASGDEAGWLALAEEIRALHGELMRDLKDFSDAAREAQGLAGDGESARWAVLAQVRSGYLQELKKYERDDPHEGRRDALRDGRIEPATRVALIGVAEVNALVRRLLAQLGNRATLFVVAPPDAAAAFDAAGAVVPAAWTSRPIALGDASWRFADRPDEQAESAAAWLADRAPRFARDQVVLGVPDPEVVPHLQRRLDELGAATRDARGTPLSRTSPARLLAAVHAHLATPSFASFAALMRHPELFVLLRRDDARLPADLLARIDEYHAEHLPDGPSRDWPAPRDGEGHEASRLVLRAREALDRRLAPLRAPVRPPAEWVAPLADLLGAAWPDKLDDAQPDERLVAGALAALGDALRELAVLPAEIGALSAADALALLLRDVERGNVPFRADPDSIELLGWLELPLDDSPVLVVTGLNEGRVPASVRGDPLLPDALRRALNLPDDERRLARDAYALAVLAAARRELLLVTGRRSQAGDPLRPSRLLFLAPPDVALARAREFCREPPPAPRSAADLAPRSRRRPLREVDAPVTRVSVTGLGLYLRSPYAYYLERVLGLQRGLDDTRELDPAAFGRLAHSVLAALAEPEAQRLTEGAQLAALLEARLEGLAHARFGAQPAPAVRLQLANLGWRLAGFAAWQAAQHAAGWRVTHAEWGPKGGVPFDVEGGRLVLTGTLDRIEIGPEGRWRIADYKTGDKGEGPEQRHGGVDGAEWRDLQLPLYAELVAPLRGELEGLGARGDPELGYVVLPRERPEADGWWLRGEWLPADRENALLTARRAGGRLLRGEFDRLGEFEARDEIVAAILGERLLVATDDEAEEEGE